MEKHLILMSHGNMAEEVLKSAEMIVGEISGASALCMSSEEGLEGIHSKLKTVLKEQEHCEILIIADLFGGTPFNAAVMTKKDASKIEIVTGMNLGMVIEYSVSQIESLSELAHYMENIGKRGIRVQVVEDEEDEIDF